MGDTQADNDIQAITLDAEQAQAVAMCGDIEKRLVAITGEAGTGKTTIIKQTCEALQARGISFALAAPTGKAARRIREATGFPAVTIHKLLAFNRPDMDDETGEATSASMPGYGADRRLPYKVIIVDEYAMVSTALHRDLVSALASGACLRVFGDIRQLPPIENEKLADPTSPFNKCLKMPHSVTLQNVYRQAEGNGILEAARRVARGDFFTRNQDINVHFSDITLRKLYDFLDASSIAWHSIDNQIISPARKSDIGTVKLNSVLQMKFNPDQLERIELPRTPWEKKAGSRCFVALHDKVVCNVNTYDLRNYHERYAEWITNDEPVLHSFIPCPETKQMLNGEVGRIVLIGVDGTLEVDFGDRIVEIPPVVEEYSLRHRHTYLVDPRKSIELAYALTTHKCQGSEYQNVVYVMARVCFYNLNRQNFYTAITRARSHVDVISDQAGFNISLKRLINTGGKPSSLIRK